MSDSNIYMAIVQSVCFPMRERSEGTEGRTRKEWRQAETDGGSLQLQNRGRRICDAICPLYFRIRWSPSPSSSAGVWWSKNNPLILIYCMFTKSFYRTMFAFMQLCCKTIPVLRADLWQCWSGNCSHLESYKPSRERKKKSVEIFMQSFLSNNRAIC